MLNDRELDGTHPGVFLTDQLYRELVAWVQQHYRDHLHPDDFTDVKLVDQTRQALDELTRILRLGSIYPFQKA